MNIIMITYFILGVIFGWVVYSFSKYILDKVNSCNSFASITPIKSYLNPQRVLAWDDLVPWSQRCKNSMWSDSIMYSDPKPKFESIWNRVRNGKDFRYYIDKYEFDISFNAGDFGWVTLNNSCGMLTICCHKTSYRHHLPYNHNHTEAYYCKELTNWYNEIYEKARKEWNKDMNL